MNEKVRSSLGTLLHLEQGWVAFGASCQVRSSARVIYLYLFMRLAHDGTPLFPNLGVHCSYPSCAQLDFLPFRCSQCEKVYCLDHRTCDAHECTAASSSSSSAAGGFVVVCPICAAAVPLASTQDDANLAWERHRTSGACDEANYARVHKKPVCPAPGCRQKLNLSNKVVCKNCGIATCLKHRFPEDHKCTKRRAGGGGASAEGVLANYRHSVRDCDGREGGAFREGFI